MAHSNFRAAGSICGSSRGEFSYRLDLSAQAESVPDVDKIMIVTKTSQYYKKIYDGRFPNFSSWRYSS